MRKFIFKLSIFILAFILLAVTADIVISKKLKSSKAMPCENEVWNDIYNSKINADIAILGSSRAWVHFNSTLIEDSLNVNCYNLGEDGSNFVLQYLRYKEYLSYNPSPKLVILAMDYNTFSDRSNGYPTLRYYPYMLWNFRVYNIVKPYDNTINRNEYFFPLLRYVKSKHTVESLLQSKKKPYSKTFNKIFELNENGKLRDKDYRGMDLPWNNDGYRKVNIKITPSPSIIRLFEGFIKELKQKSIKLLVVYPPEYIEGQKSVSNRAEIISSYRSITAKHKVPFIDYSKTQLSQRKELFYNILHLNKTGSKLFTQQIIIDVRKHIYNPKRSTISK